MGSTACGRYVAPFGVDGAGLNPMILSVHLADVGARAALELLRRPLVPGELPGLRYAEITIAAPMSGRLLPTPSPGRVGLIAGWENDGALDRFLDKHLAAQRLAGGWHVRLQPVRVSGAWSALPGLPDGEQPIDDDEPAAVLTLGRLKLASALRFLRTSAPAEGLAVRSPALLASTLLARPLRLVATFSLWRTTAAMRAYAYGHAGPDHLAAIKAQRERPLHRESAFIRCRPYAPHGTWDGRQPLQPHETRDGPAASDRGPSLVERASS